MFAVEGPDTTGWIEYQRPVAGQVAGMMRPAMLRQIVGSGTKKLFERA